jgi:hypothetical protein
VIHKSNYIPLKDVAKISPIDNREIDLLVKILLVSEKDEQSIELRVKDVSNEMWFLTLPKIKFSWLLENNDGEIVRIRSVMRDMTSRRNTIVARNMTNVLKFMSGVKVIKEL